MLRVGYLGPEGTFSHQALRSARAGRPPVEAIAQATLYDTVMGVQDRQVDAALVPIENAIEGSVDVTLDTLARDGADVVIVGETVERIRNCLIAAARIGFDEIESVYSHPQPNAQCARFLRTQLPGASVHAVNSTAEAVRVVADAPAGAPVAALGNRLAADLYGGVILLEDVDDVDGNETRFVWLARAERAEEIRALVGGSGAAKTSIVFWGGGDVTPGWLVSCLAELSSRDIDLTRIESRPRRVGLGHYMFFADLRGGDESVALSEAIAALRGHCEEVRVLGSFRGT